MKKQLITAFVCVGMLSTLLTGCGSKSSAPSTSGSSEGQKVTLELYHLKPEDVKVYTELLAKFTQENPNITINQTCPADASKAFVTRIAANDPPDLVATTPLSTQIQAMMGEDVFVAQDDQPYLSRAKKDSLELVRYKKDGHIYAMPITVNAFGIFYNKDIFAANNIKIPNTIEELYAVCDKLKAAGIQPFTWTDKDTVLLPQQFDRMLIGGVDHTPWDKYKDIVSGKYSMTKDAGMRKYAEVILKLREYGQKDSLGTGAEQGRGDFAQGKCAMFADGTWSATAFNQLNPSLKFGCFATPNISVKESTTAGVFDTAFAVLDGKPHHAECFKFINYMVRDDIAQIFCDGDKNPNVINGVKYNVPELDTISSMITNGRFSLGGATVWPTTMRTDQCVATQQLITDKDVDKFLKRIDEIIIANFK